MRQTQLSVDERMAALLRVVDTDVESSGKHIDKCRQIDPCAVDAAYGSREMQCRFQFHDIRRRELFGEEQRRFRDFDRYRGGDGRIRTRVKTKRISKFVNRSADLSNNTCGDSFSTIRSCNRIRQDWRRASSCSRSRGDLQD